MKTISTNEKIAYGLGSLGNNLIYGLMSTYLIVFYTDTWGIAPSVVGLIFLFARLWDGVNDPIMGLIVDNTRSRWGRFRPYLLFVPPISATITILTFWGPDLSAQAKIIWATTTYILWGMSFTAMDIPYWSFSAAITQDPNERNSVVMIPRTLATVGIILINIITLPLVGFFGGENEILGWRSTAALVGVIGVLFTWITFLKVRERITPEGKPRLTLKGIWILFRNNRPLGLLILSMLIFETIFAVKMIFPIYYLTYNFHAEHLIPVFMALYAVVTVVGSVLAPVTANKFGKKNVAIWGGVVICLSSVGMFFSGYNSIPLLLFWSAVWAFADGMANIARMSMLADTVDYGEWKTGRRAEGMVFSANIFKTKLSGALGGSIGAFLLAAINYVPNAEQTVDTLNGIHIFFTVAPGVLGFAALIPLLFYNLKEDRFKEIVAELHERNHG